MKKILLVYPGQKNIGDINMPLALLFVAKPLVDAGYQVVLLDERIEDYKKIDLTDLLCVGISTMSGQMIEYALEIAEYIKSKNSALPIVWGGPHPTLDPENTIKSELADIVVVGEGEDALLEIVRSLENQKPLDNIKGILFNEKGKVISTPPRPQKDFDQVTHLPYELFDERLYPNLVDKFEYHSGKGCPFKCTFCSSVANAGRTWRSKSPRVVMEELDYIMEKFSPKRFVFMDPMFFLNKQRVADIARAIIKRKWKVEIYSFCRADVFSKFDPDFLRLIREAGFNEIAFGFESGSQRVLDFIQKGTTLEQQLKTVELCREADIIPIMSFIIGIPTETEAELKQTLDLYDRIKKMYPRSIINGLFIFVPFPGAPLTTFVSEKYGYTPPATLDEWKAWRWSDKKNIGWLSKRKLNQLEGISIISRYLFTMDLLKSWNYKQKLVRHGSLPILAASLLFNYFFWLPAKIRWRLRWFGHAYEIKFWEKVLVRFKGNN